MKNKKRLFSLLLLSIIYLSFVALGLPDALLGSAWNLIRKDLNVPLSTLGLMTFVVYLMSLLSTYHAPRLLRLFQTKWIVFISIAFTGSALIVISQVTVFYQMLFFAIPLGMGAGAIDVSLNHYLAKHYKASHMNYLHSFYGIGVTLGPLVMAYTLSNNVWRVGYIIVGSMLLGIALLVLSTYKLWHPETKDDKEMHDHITLKEALKIKKAFNAMIIFLLYVHVESLLGVWIASYMYLERGVSYAMAALFTTIYFFGLTLGRLIAGLLAHKVSSKYLIITGISLMMIGSMMLFVQVNILIINILIIFLLGLGAGPIFPNMMVLNNVMFEKKQLSKMISLQMVIGYMGFGLLTPLAGFIFDQVSINLFPVLLCFSLTLLSLAIFMYLKARKPQGVMT